MKKLSKGTWFTLFLLCIALIEGIVVLYDIIHPGKDSFLLAKTELDVPAQEVYVRPMPFERSEIDQYNTAVRDLFNELSENLLEKIYRISSGESSSELNSERNSQDNTKLKAIDETAENGVLNSGAVEKFSSYGEENTQAKLNISSEFTGEVQNVAWDTVAVDGNEEPKATEIAPEGEKEHPLLQNSTDNNVKSLLHKGETLIAIVVDDMGVSVSHTKDILNLKRKMTASFLPYSPANKEQVKEAKNSGFEVMLHAPMMPHVAVDLAPITLSPKMDKSELKEKFEKMIDRYEGEGMLGVNNHMGSLFTESAESMDVIMEVLKSKQMYFLDSKTTAKSVAKASAKKYGVPYIARDVFLDNENNYDYIMSQLKKTEKISRMRGYAVAICHPRTQTYKALRDWVETLDKKRIKLVHIKDLIQLVNDKM